MSRTLKNQPILIQVLSVYLLLLAFFLALTRLSAAERTRLEAVAGSLDAAFASVGRPSVIPAPFTASLGNVLADAAPLARIGDLVRTELAFATMREVVPGTVMELTVDSERLFVGDRVAIEPLYRRFLERLGTVLAEPPPGVRYDVEIAIGISAAAAAGDPSTRRDIGRAAFLGGVLAGAGAPARTLAAGIEPGAPPRVRMVFHVRPALEPPPPFAQEPSR